MGEHSGTGEFFLMSCRDFFQSPCRATAASEHFLSVAESNPPLPLPPVDNSVDPELIVLGRMYSLSTSEHDPAHMRTQLGTCAPPRSSGN